MLRLTQAMDVIAGTAHGATQKPSDAWFDLNHTTTGARVVGYLCGFGCRSVPTPAQQLQRIGTNVGTPVRGIARYNDLPN